MIISDLQHIKFATETEVQASGGRRYQWRPWYQCHTPDASANPEAFSTYTETSADTLVIKGQFSGSGFNTPSEFF